MPDIPRHIGSNGSKRPIVAIEAAFVAPYDRPAWLVDRFYAEIDTQTRYGREKLDIKYLSTLAGRPSDVKVELAAGPTQIGYELRCVFKLSQRLTQKIRKFTIIAMPQIEDAIALTVCAGQRSTFGRRTIFANSPRALGG